MRPHVLSRSLEHNKQNCYHYVEMNSFAKNSLIVVFVLVSLSIFNSCGTIMDGDINIALSQINEIEPQIIQDDYFIYPLQSFKITSYFGNRRDPINGGRHFHNGVDFAVLVGETVMASMSGIVTITAYHPGNGYYVKINHNNGFKTIYCHLDSFIVQPGEIVERGQKIAESGNTGNTSGPHLHFTMYNADDEAINPLELLKQADEE